MSETQFTPAQLDAIQSREENLLVAAGAGSGKTTVLVERIIRRLQSGGKIQRLLVLTFTHAAADDMRAKIQRALSQLCREQPGNSDFRQQLALLPQAHISTVHSFCLELLRSHYYRVGLPADFRVASEVEMELLRQECLEACMEQAYGDAESGLAALADAYGGVHDDSQLSQIILDLHSYSQSRPDPALWLRQSAAQLLSGETVDELWGAEPLCRGLQQQLARIIDSLRQAALLPEIPRLYQELAWVEIAQAEQVCNQQSLQAMAAALSTLEFQRLPSGAKKLAEGYPPGHVFDAEQMERFKKLRTAAKDDLKKLAARYGSLTAAEAVEEQHSSGRLMQSLVDLVLDLDERLREAKLSRAWIDYGDMEHLTLALLSDEDFAQSLAAGFDEVLIDEYQDINQVQEAIFSRLRRGENFFAVGDVKQSVYRFRLAEPQLFLSKYLDYGAGEGGRRIDLNQNFRSHISVIQGVNQLFRQLMLAEVAELDYDEAAALHPGRPEQGAPPEFWLVERKPVPQEAREAAEEEDGGEDEDAEESGSLQLEARFIAQRIRELRQEGYAYGDMAILLRSLKSSRDIVIRELESAGIPISAEGAGGYLDSPELEMALSLLKLIDNPRQDQPLAGLLRSPLLGFSDEELLSLRLEQPEGELYDCLLHAAEGDSPLSEKLRDFFGKLESWRAAAGELRPSALLLRLYEEAGFYHLCGALPGGETRQAYLRLLYQQACSYEQQSYAGLYRFICQLEDSRAWGKGELSPAKTGGADSVQLMSIHKSKGLEFPVVFVAGLNHCFNFRDELADVIWDRDLGLGARYAERDRRRKYPTLAHLAIAERKHEQALAEEMRIYYVALTRAKERLILSACLERPERAAANWAQVAEWPEQQLPLHVLARARKPLDWFGPALIRHPDSAALRQRAECSAAPQCWEESRWRVQLIPAPGPLSPEEAAFCPLGGEGDAKLESLVEAALFYQYPGREKCLFPAKWAVSSLNRQPHSSESRAELAISSAALADSQPNAAPAEGKAPGLSSEQEDPGSSTAAERGTAYHRVLELLDLKRVELPQLKAQVDELCEKGLLSPEAKSLVEPSRLEKFFRSPVGRRLCASERVQRETAFTMLMEEQGVEVLAQGMLDAAFKEEDGWVLLDYKTGGWQKSDAELRQLYGQQLSCYRQAIERLWRVPVKEAYLCMLDSGRVVAV